MKQLIKIIYVVALSLGLAACGGGEGSSTPASEATYSLIYDGNGNDSGVEPIEGVNYTTGQSVTVAGNPGNLALAGHSFIGWNTAADGSGTTYAQGQSFVMGTADVVLYACWSANTTYSVTYDGNTSDGGSVPVDSTNYEAGQTVTVAGNSGALTKAGCSFTGWNTADDGSGTGYAPGGTFAMGTADLTLYAQWTLNPTYTVTYDGNGNSGGSVPTDTTGYEQGQTVTVLGNPHNLVLAGYSFVGWNTADDGSGTTYLQGQTFAIGAADVVLYAQWSLNPTYSVTYDGNTNDGGSVPVDSSRYEQGQTVTVAGNSGILTKGGHYFTGWNTAADGSGTGYTTGGTFAMGTADVTLYAQWTMNPTYTVTYDGNTNTGGSVPVDSTNYEQGWGVLVLANTGNLTKGGYYFTGWNTAADGSGTDYAPNDQFIMGDADVTLYALWSMKQPTILYNAGSRNGNLGGRSGANAICAAAKPAVCGTRDKVHAFLSSNQNSIEVSISDIPAASGIDPATAIMGPGSRQISANWAGLLDGEIDASMAAAEVLPNVGVYHWWSGSMFRSSSQEFVTVWDCQISGNSWTRSDDNWMYPGITGSSIDRFAPEWYDDHTTNSSGNAVVPGCNESHYLLCVCGE